MLILCSDNDFTLVAFIADAPIRAQLRGIVQHGGFFACDICEEKATPSQSVTRKTQVEGKRRSERVLRGTSRLWPKTTLGGPLRTHDRLLQVRIGKLWLTLNSLGVCFQLASEIAIRERDELYGVIKMSPLADVPTFDIQKQLLPEIQHLIDLGLIKLAATATFQGPGKRPSNGSFDRVNPTLLNAQLEKIKVSMRQQ